MLFMALIAASRSQDGVQYERNFGVVGNHLRYCRNGFNAAEQSDLERRNRHVLEHAARLIGHPFRVNRKHVLYTHGVLNGNGCDARQRVASHARERHDVSLHTGASAGVRSGEYEHDGWKFWHGGMHARGLACSGPGGIV
jgi:hypothetical protein